MPASDLRAGAGPGKPQNDPSGAPQPSYRLTMFDPPSTLVSVIRQLRELFSSPKVTVPRQYYRGEKALPITEMPPWYRDLPNQIRALFEKPDTAKVPPAVRRILEFNSQQEKKRVFLGAVCGCLAATAGGLVAQSAALATVRHA